MRVFLDTNVLAAAFGTRGLCSDLMREGLENHELVTSLDILAELKRILIKKFRAPSQQVDEIIDLIQSSADTASPAADASYAIADSDDIPHLSAAENGRCSVFVTGDKELWTISPIDQMKVCSPREFWRMISAEQ